MGKHGIFEYLNLKYEDKVGKYPPHTPYKIYRVVSDDPKELKHKHTPVGKKLLALGFKWVGNSFRTYENKMTMRMYNGVKEINDELARAAELDPATDPSGFQAMLEQLKDKIAATEMPTATQSDLEIKLNNVIKRIADATEEQADALFQQYLNFSSKFHKYTPENQALVFAQDPNATKVKGPTAWKKLGREVIDLQNTITINCGNEWYVDPVSGEKEEYTLDLQNDDNLYQLKRQRGRIPADTARDKLIKIRRDAMGKNTTFDPCVVYDVANTKGRPLAPEGQSQWNADINVNNDNSAVANQLFQIAVKSLQMQGIRVTQNPSTAGEAGWSRGGQINISPDVSGTYALSTIIKQWASALLTKPGGQFYSKLVKYFEDKGELTPANIEQIKRVEESTVAAAVCGYFGLPTDEAPRRNDLLAAQGGLSSEEVIRENVSTISTVSTHIIKAIKQNEQQLNAVAAEPQEQTPPQQ